MKKRLISTILTTVLALSSVNVVAMEATNYTSSDAIVNNECIEKTLEGYFSFNLREEKEHKSLDNPYIVDGSTLEKYNNLKYELKGKVNKKNNLNLEYYSSKAKINSINYVDGLVEIDVDNEVNCKYDQCDTESYYIESHIIKLQQIDNKLLVREDISNLGGNASEIKAAIEKDIKVDCTRNEFFKNSYEENNSYDNYVNSQIEILNEKMNKFDNEGLLVNNIKANSKNISQSEKLNTARLATSNYNASGAVSWALNNVYSSERYPGADCTNFVSNAIHYGGGIPKDYTYGWYENTYKWIRVNDFWEWLCPMRGYACDYMADPQTSPGDIIQLFKGSSGTFTHSLMVTSRRASILYVSAHSNAAYNVPLTNYTTDSQYTNQRNLIFV